MNKLFVIIGQTCSGKNYLLEEVLRKYDIPLLTSYTTRPKRPSEREGIEYNFVTVQEFKEHYRHYDLLEYSSFKASNGDTWFYYTLKNDIDLSENNMIKIVDPIGLSQIRQELRSQLVVIYITCDEHIRRQRYLERGETEDNVEDRLARDKVNFKYVEGDYILINDGSRSIDELSDGIIKIIKKESGKA